MSPFEPDDGLDALLRDSMRDTADTVMPSGDGLSRIQQRVTTRRLRQRWMRPTMALGSAALVGLVAVGAYAAVHGKGTATIETPPIATQPPTTPPSTDSSPSPTQPPAAAAFPKHAIFPFVSAKDERAFEQEAASGTNPWGDPAAVAKAWVTTFLQLPSVNQVGRQVLTPTKADIRLGRMQTDGSQQRPITVTTVHLVKFGTAWLVTGATDGSRQLRVDAPAAGTRVTSPLVASGPGGGVDRAASVQVRDATTATSYGTGHTGSFGVQGWSADVSFSSPSNPVGVLLVVENSNADGLPLRVAAEQVRFGSSSVSAGPQYFYGIKDGRVTKFAASSGAALDYLTDPHPGGPASDAQLVGNDVYFIRATGPCSGALHKVSTATSDNTRPEKAVASPDDGYAITGFAIFASGGQASSNTYSYFEQACGSSTSPQAKLVSLNGGHRHVVNFAGMPPRIVADPSFEPPADLQFLDAIVNIGTQSRLVRYDTYNTTSPTPSRNACPGYDLNNGRPWALETDPSGMIWFATQTGSSMQVVKCAAGSQTAAVAFTVPGNRQPADVDVSSDGSVLLTDTDGHIWRWDGSGDAHPLAPHQAVTSVTW
jgi:hypothetical protein